MLRRATRPNIAKRKVSVGASIPAPTGGWDAVSSLDDMPEDRAVVLDNWFPTTSDVRVRRGHKVHAANMGTSVVDSLLPYHGLTSAASKLFAATDGKIYDATAQGNATSSLTSQNNNRWQYVNFTVTGGKYLWICNGTDAPQHYDGSSWAAPSLSITTYTAADIIHVNAHKNRLWFVFKDTTKAGYLPTGQVAGTVTNFELGGLFTKGGYLMAMATWTMDGGDGVDDKAVFISSRGQAAVYVGTDPSSANTWQLEGVFDLGPPIGRRCFTKVAGDLALINVDGVLPLSRALSQDRGAAAAIAITKNINNAMNDAARLYKDNFGWELTPYAKGTMAVLNVPLSVGTLQHQYVMNTLTGAWCRFKGMNANCWAVFNDNLYFGGNDGFVYQADTTGTDVSVVIQAEGQTAYNYLKSRGQLKQLKMIQPLVTTDSDARPAIGASTDFKDNAQVGTPTAATVASALFDTAVYDTDVYAVEGRSVSDWTSISGLGQCASIHFRARTGPTAGLGLWGIGEWDEAEWSEPLTGDITLRLNGFNCIYENGGFF